MFVITHLRTLSSILFITKYTRSTIEFEITFKKKITMKLELQTVKLIWQ
jgi:hypothetical protein